MVARNIDPKKVSFWVEIFMTCGPLTKPNLPILVLSTKTRNMHEGRTSFHDTMHDVRYLRV